MRSVGCCCCKRERKKQESERQMHATPLTAAITKIRIYITITTTKSMKESKITEC